MENKDKLQKRDDEYKKGSDSAQRQSANQDIANDIDGDSRNANKSSENGLTNDKTVK